MHPGRKGTIVTLGGLVALTSATVGCAKLSALAKDDGADGGAVADAATVTAPATTAAQADAAVPSATVAAKGAPPAATVATTRPRNKDGSCPAGFLGLGPPTNLTLPCLKQCTVAADCGKGSACKDEQAFGGRTVKVCETDVTAASSTNTKPLAVPSPTTDRFPRNRLKDGPCPAGFSEEPGVEEHSKCARTCKTDSDCHAHTCVDSDVGAGKVCSDIAATKAAPATLPKCKGEERLWAASEKAKPFCATGEPSCSSDKDCKGTGSCVEMMMINDDGEPARSHNGAPLGAKFCRAK